MGNKDSRSGGKYSGNHTTLTPLAAEICDLANRCPEVVEISPGFLKAGLRSVNGQRRVKIVDVSGGIKLSVRDNTSHQEVHILIRNAQAAKLFVAKGCRNKGIAIGFGKEERKREEVTGNDHRKVATAGPRHRRRNDQAKSGEAWRVDR